MKNIKIRRPGRGGRVRRSGQTTMIPLGSLVYVRYLDHVLFKNVDPNAFAKTFMQETIGWLDHEDDEGIRIVWERFAEPNLRINQKATGLVILKSAILEMQRVNGSFKR